MRTQQDHSVRVVALSNLVAMCKRVSGVCHNYHVSRVSRSRVHVEYSNPDEWANDHPMTAVLPCYPSGWQGDEDNPRVVLDILRVINDSWDGEGWQAFDTILDCPTLWRDPDGKGWSSEQEIKLAKENHAKEGQDNSQTGASADSRAEASERS